jgi:hypothetical protein
VATRDQVCHPTANSAGFLDQGYHPPRVFLGTAVIVGTLPEAATPAADAGRPRFQVGEIHQVNQRAVTKQPHPVVVIESMPALVFFESVFAHPVRYLMEVFIITARASPLVAIG